MFEFEMPVAFLLLPLPLVIYLLSPAFRDHSEAVRVPFFQRIATISGQTPSRGSIVRQKNLWQKICVGLSWLLLVMAVAKPVLIEEPIVRNISARDMLLLVDLSGSMDERDFTTEQGQLISRLDAVKTVLSDFIQRRDGDRVGLAVFGDAAFPQTSFTEDLGTVQSLLQELQPRMAGPRTMIGDAIGLAIRLFEASDKQNKVAILLTDGNDTGSQMPVAKAAQIAARNGLVIHTIAMGNPETVGEQALDLSLLRDISSVTGGQFFLALNRTDLDAIYDELDRIEPQLLETLSYRPTVEYFYVPLALMLVLNLGFMLSLVFLRRTQSSIQHSGQVE